MSADVDFRGAIENAREAIDEIDRELVGFSMLALSRQLKSVEPSTSSASRSTNPTESKPSLRESSTLIADRWMTKRCGAYSRGFSTRQGASSV